MNFKDKIKHEEDYFEDLLKGGVEAGFLGCCGVYCIGVYVAFGQR